MTRYTYATGYKTRESAELALEDMFAEGEVSPGEDPQIEPARVATIANGGVKSRVTGYIITLKG